MLKINTLTQFIALIILALTLSLWELSSMLVLVVVLVSLLIYQKNKHFFHMIKRLKWFFIAMLCVFLFNTPGEHMVSWSYSIKPTFEGLHAGLRQAVSVMLMLAALSLILAKNTVQQLISGLYHLLSPLSLAGVNVQRFAARLWLTLHYVELQEIETPKTPLLTQGLSERLNNAFADNQAQYVDVSLEKNVLAWPDYIAFLLMLVFLAIVFVDRGF